MPVPDCPNCGEPVTRILDLAYGHWQWDDNTQGYQRRTCSSRVDAAPSIHADYMGELRDMHPQNYYSTTG